MPRLLTMTNRHKNLIRAHIDTLVKNADYELKEEIYQKFIEKYNQLNKRDRNLFWDQIKE